MIPVINRSRKVAKFTMVRFCEGGFISKRMVAAYGVSGSGKVSRNIYS